MFHMAVVVILGNIIHGVSVLKRRDEYQNGTRRNKQNNRLMGMKKKNGRKSAKNRKHMVTGEFQECAVMDKKQTDTSSPLQRMSNDVFHSWQFRRTREMGPPLSKSAPSIPPPEVV